MITLIALIAIFCSHVTPVVVSDNARARVEGVIRVASSTAWLIAVLMRDGDPGNVGFVVTVIWGLRQAVEHEGDVEQARLLVLVEQVFVILSLGWMLCVA